jgi:hypothetical protein
VPRTQRLAAWLACMTVAICSVGVPLPARAVKKSGEAFPCQNCPCGCKDADTCWRECCCFTHRQKLAWAERNRVTPPAFVIAAARRETRDAATESQSCCRGKPEVKMQASGAAAPTIAMRPCCQRRTALCSAAPCSTRSNGDATGSCSTCEGQASDKQASTPERRRSSDAVLLVSKLRCGGISLSVSAMPPSVVTRVADFHLDMPVRFEPLVCDRLLYEPPVLAVAAPPPDAPSS